MPSNLSADERAAVDDIAWAIAEACPDNAPIVRRGRGEGLPVAVLTYGKIRTLLAVVARAGEPVDYGHLAHCNAGRSAPIGPNRSCVCWNLMQDGIAHRTNARAGEPVARDMALARRDAFCDGWDFAHAPHGATSAACNGARREASVRYPLPTADARDRGDAVRGVLLAFHDWPAHSSAFADGERRRALDTLAATMHAAPAAPEDK